MRKAHLLFAASALALACVAAPALAWHLTGNVFCDGNGLPFSNIVITVSSTGGCSPPFTGSATTDEFGAYSITLPDGPCCYTATVSLGPGQTITVPASGSFSFCTDEVNSSFVQNWVVASPECGQGACWLTGGGAKFEPVDNLRSGTNGPNDTWGGNVNPGCSPTAGDGGSWNHVAHTLKLHFHGQAIQVVRCGNVDGIPPGSDSPVTPFNFIEFTGTGTLKGIQGNKVDYGTVSFFARAEDRNEPGSAGQHDGELIDRYFLNVYSNPADPVGSSLLLIDQDGDPATVDPILITDGNMQLHISSCATPISLTPVSNASSLSRPIAAEGARGSGELWFAAPSPSPARSTTVIRFNLPRDANVSLAAFDVTGRLVHVFASGRLSPGEHSFDWSLRNDYAQRLGAGVYFVRLIADGRVQTRPVVIQP